MSESSSPDRDDSSVDSICALALVFSDRGRKIAVTDGSRPALPGVTIRNRYFPEIEEFLQAAVRALGVNLRLLRCLDDSDREKGRGRLYSLAADSRADGLNDGFQWMDSSEVGSIAGLLDTQKVSIQLERDRVSGGLPDRPVVPWEWPGQWNYDTRRWISEHLKSRYTRADWTVTPVRWWSISSVARIDTGAALGSERFFFKASPAFFSNEAAVTAAVAERFPDISPRLMAVNTTRGWMLMGDLGDLTLGAADSVDLWREAVRALARIQIGFANDTGSLERLGLERRTTSAVGSTISEWTHNPGSLGLRYASQRAQSALGRLQPHLDLVEQLCEKVDSAGLPLTLDHGDLDAGNVFIRDGSPVIMDWSDASISSPLFAPALISQVLRNPQLVDEFLAVWSDYATLNELREAFEAAKPIAALERAFHYHRNIVAHLAYPSVDLRVLEAYVPELLNLAASGLERYG